MSVKKPEIVWFGGTPPPLFGKKTNYFRFFHLTASLRQSIDAALIHLVSVLRKSGWCDFAEFLVRFWYDFHSKIGQI